jgi:hypothetical protein
MALELINEHPNVIVRRQYAGDVAMRCGLPPADLVSMAERGVRNPHVRVESAKPAVSSDGPEVTVLRLLVHRWDETAARVVPAMFAEPVNRRAIDALAAADGDVRAAIDGADPEAAELLMRVAVEEANHDPAIETDRLLRSSVERQLVVRRAVLTSDEFLATASMVRPWLHGLGDVNTMTEAMGELLGWLDGWDREP